MPRKTVFKPIPRPNLAKDPLWREVFLSESESDSNEGNKTMIRDLDQSIKKQSRLDNSDLMSVAQSDIKNVTKISTMAKIESKRNASAKIQNKKQNLKQNYSFIETEVDELTLPPIIRPLLYEDLREVR